MSGAFQNIKEAGGGWSGTAVGGSSRSCVALEVSGGLTVQDLVDLCKAFCFC